MRLEDVAAERLSSIIEPFDLAGAGISIVIEDIDGRVFASAGTVVADRESADAGCEIVVAGEVIGRVVGNGLIDPSLIEAIVASVAASAAALVEAATTRGGMTTVDEARHAAEDRLDAELALARRIQRSFVSLVPPDVPGYELAGQYAAAREVGGDFFDVFRTRRQNGRLAITIADVTGKGIAAALLMAFVRPLLHSAVDNAATPADALERVNRILVEERRAALFVTALCAVVVLRGGVLRLANAGHEPPLHVPAGDGPVVSLEGSGPLLGVFPRLELVESSIVMAPGDLVLCYTDGVTDAQASNGERFGDERLFDVLHRSRGGTAAAVASAVFDACHRFQGAMPAADDIAIVAIRRDPRPPRRRRRPADRNLSDFGTRHAID